MCPFIITKRKGKRNSKEKGLKLRKIDRRKRKMLVSKAFHNTKHLISMGVGSHSSLSTCSDTYNLAPFSSFYPSSLQRTLVPFVVILMAECILFSTAP